MKKITAGILVTLLFFSCICIGAQDIVNPASELTKNSLNIYIGLFELNINYERNIIQCPKSHTNVRMGFGKILNEFGGEGTFLNPSVVQLFGKGNYHLELDLGFKYMVTNSLSDPDFFETFVPDIFAGYRYEKPSGNFVFRAGNSFPTFINVGVGYKF
jgi:hypothetical protein